MSLHIKSPGELPGVYPIAQRGADLKYLSFTIVELGGNLKEHVFDSGEEEICLDFYTGAVRVAVGTYPASTARRRSPSPLPPASPASGQLMYPPMKPSRNRSAKITGRAPYSLTSP